MTVRSGRRSGVATAMILVFSGCVSEREYRVVKMSLQSVQDVCEDGTNRASWDGWGHLLVQLDEPDRGFMVVSLGRDGTPSRQLTEFWDPAACGTLGSVDDEIVCVNGVLRRWPELSRVDRGLFRLPRECTDEGD